MDLYMFSHRHLLMCDHSYASAADDTATSSDMPRHGGGASDEMTTKSDDRRRKELAVARVLLYLGTVVRCTMPHAFLISHSTSLIASVPNMINVVLKANVHHDQHHCIRRSF